MEATDQQPPMFSGWLRRTVLKELTVFSNDILALAGEDRVEYVRWNTLAAVRELGEALNLVDGWKPWQTQRATVGEFKDRAKYVEELVDLLHFVANLLCVAGVTDEELTQIYEDKMRVNAARQETGYAGDGAAWDALHRSTEGGKQ